MLRIHVEGLSTAGAGQVQMGVAVFRTHILVIGLSASRFYRFTDQPLRLQLGQIPVDGTEADLLGAQLLSDLPYRQQLIRMLIEKAD